MDDRRVKLPATHLVIGNDPILRRETQDAEDFRRLVLEDRSEKVR
jgi:hypothetical protein